MTPKMKNGETHTKSTKSMQNLVIDGKKYPNPLIF